MSDDFESNRCFVLTSTVEELRELPEFKRLPFLAWELLDEKWSPMTRDIAYDLLAKCLGKSEGEQSPHVELFNRFWKDHPECLY